MSPQYLRECAATLQGFSYYKPLAAWMNAQAAAMDASFAPPQPAAVEPRGLAFEQPRCGNCRFWASIKGEQGECRRMPPMQFFSMQRRHQDTRDTHWCGEFSLREVTP